jgi:hypothetical protein
MVRYAGPVVLFVAGILAWIIPWPGDQLDLILMWCGIVACIAALFWAALLAVRYRNPRV